jgi:hypothetical protein
MADIAHHSLPDQLLGAEGGRIKAEIMPDTCFPFVLASEVHQFLSFLGVDGERLFNIGVGSMANRCFPQREVGLGWGCNVNNIGLMRLEELLEIRVIAWHRKANGSLFSHDLIRVAHGHQSRFRNLLDFGDVQIGNLAATNDRNAQFIFHIRDNYRAASNWR